MKLYQMCWSGPSVGSFAWIVALTLVLLFITALRHPSQVPRRNVQEIQLFNEDANRDLNVRIYNADFTGNPIDSGTAVKGQPLVPFIMDFSESSGNVDGPWNTLVGLEFETDDEAVTKRYLYYQCDLDEEDPAPDQFFCPHTSSSNEDMTLTWTGSKITTKLDGLEPAEPPIDVQSKFGTDTRWIVPYNLDTYCAGTESGCSPWIVGYFFTPQTNYSSWSFPTKNIEQPNETNVDWGFDGENVTFQEDYYLKIVKGLEVSGSSVLNFSGTAQTLQFASGSSSSIASSTVNGANTSVVGTLALSGTTTFDGGSFSANTNNLTFSGTTTFDEVELTVESGKTVTIPSGATVSLVGTQANPGIIDIKGTLVVESGGTLQCSDNYAWVVANVGTLTPNGTVDDECLPCAITLDDSPATLSSTKTCGTDDRLVNLGGTITLNDNVDIVYQSSAPAPVISPGSTFKMGDDSRITFERAVTLAGTQGNEIVFERKSPSDAWDYIDLKADDNSFSHVVLDGGYKTVEIRSDNNTFSNVTFKNGWRGVSSYGSTQGGKSSFTLTNCIIEDNSSVGLVAYNTIFTVSNSTIQDSNEAGVYVSDATSYNFTDNIVTNNALTTSTTRSGIEVLNGSHLYLSGHSENNIYNNLFHEIKSSGSAQIYAGDAAEGDGGDNNIYDESTPGTGEMLVYNGSSYDILAEDNWWGGAPDLNDFHTRFTIDYIPYLSSKVQKRAGEIPGIPLRERIIAAREVLNSDLAELTEKDVSTLYVLQLADVDNRLQEYNLTMSAVASVRERGIHALSDNTTEIHPAAARAMLIEIQDARFRERTEIAADYLSKYEQYITRRKQRIEMLFSKAFILRDKESLTDALATLDDIRALSDTDTEIERQLSLIEDGIRQKIVDAGGNFASTYQAGKSQDVSDSVAGDTPDVSGQIQLLDPYPNPFNPSVTLSFKVPALSTVEMAIYDILGRRVAVVADGQFEAGIHTVVFDSEKYSSGTYVVRFRAQTGNGTPYESSRLISLQK